MSVDRLASALADRYRIERELGAGGMATVYLAHDVKHDRDVAIKVLHPDLGATLGSERFLTEIRTTARLQHPHILPLLDSGSSDGLLYYVMPLVTGETLRDRLTRERQLPIDDVVRIAREVADALAHAHALGVVHRDIKPENILLQGGHAIVADFGIALAVQHAGGQRMTQTGLSLGTPQYMSPEQAMGERTIDARSDIYALGAVTYEMLTGDPPFTGSSVQAIVAKVLTEKPSLPRTVRDTVPPELEAAVLTALAKLPADRFASAHEFAAALNDRGLTRAAATRAFNARVAKPRWRDPFVLGLAAIAVALAITLGVVAKQRGASVDDFPIRVEITGVVESIRGLSAGVDEDIAPRGAAALSPDGQSVVYLGPPGDGSLSSALLGGQVIYLRRLDQLRARMMPGAVSAQAPVFSPDGKWVAFVGNRRTIVKVPIDGGAAFTLADVPDDGGIDWTTRDEIVIGAGVMEGLLGLSRVNATSGGVPQYFTQVDSTRKELSHNFPRALEDGRTVLFSIWYGALETAEIAVASIDDGRVTPLGVLGTKPLGVAAGHLVYVRNDGMIMAVLFDGRRVLGTPVPVQDSVRIRNASGGASAFLTHRGGLVFARGNQPRRLVWVDRSGVSRPALKDEREFSFVRISPDGRQVAVNANTGENSDIWVFDVGAEALTPVTNVGSARNPVWSVDGKRIFFVSTQSGRSGIWQQPVDGSGPATKVADTPHNAWNLDIAPDGQRVVWNAIYDGTFNLETMALDSTRERRDISASRTATEANGRVSPDGKFVAYMSDESSRQEIYVRAFPDGGSRIQVSVEGGTRAVWSRDGRRLYYWSQGRIIAVTLARDPMLRVVSREVLFKGNYDREFDVSADGSRFLMIEPRPSEISLVVIPNWLTELRRLTSVPSR